MPIYFQPILSVVLLVTRTVDTRLFPRDGGMAGDEKPVNFLRPGSEVVERKGVAKERVAQSP